MFNRIYRGRVLIVNGIAEVDIDKVYALKQYENIVPFAEKIKKLFCDNY